MSLMISEFYKNFTCLGVSAITGQGMDKLFDAINKAGNDYNTVWFFFLTRLFI
jgi:hypothetical protein